MPGGPCGHGEATARSPRSRLQAPQAQLPQPLFPAELLQPRGIPAASPHPSGAGALPLLTPAFSPSLQHSLLSSFPGKAWKLCRDKAVEFIRAYVRGTEKVMAAACITAVLLALPSRGPTQPQTPQGFGPAGRGCPPNALLVSLWLPGRRGAEDAVPQQNLRSVQMCHREGCAAELAWLLQQT